MLNWGERETVTERQRETESEEINLEGHFASAYSLSVTTFTLACLYLRLAHSDEVLAPRPFPDFLPFLRLLSSCEGTQAEWLGFMHPTVPYLCAKGQDSQEHHPIPGPEVLSWGHEVVIPSLCLKARPGHLGLAAEGQRGGPTFLLFLLSGASVRGPLLYSVCSSNARLAPWSLRITSTQQPGDAQPGQVGISDDPP